MLWMMRTYNKTFLTNNFYYWKRPQIFGIYLNNGKGYIDFVKYKYNYYSTFNDSTDNLYAKYKLEKKKLNKVGIQKIMGNLIDQINEQDRNNIKLLESRFNEMDNIPGYIWDGNINLNGIDENFVTEFYKVLELEEFDSLNELDKYLNYGEIIKVINLFKGVTNKLKEGKVYKLLFRWKSTDQYTYRHSYNTSPSLFIHSETDLNILMYKFITNFNVYLIKYHFNGLIDLDVFTKEWISVEELKTYDKLINRITYLDKKYKDEHELKLNLLNRRDKGYFNNDNKNYNLITGIRGLNYGLILDNRSSDYNEMKNVLNINTGTLDELYKTNIGGIVYFLKVIKRKDGINEVSLFSEKVIKLLIKRNYNNNDLNSLVSDKWTDKIYYGQGNGPGDGINEHIVVERKSQLSGNWVKFIDSEIVKTELIYNSKKLTTSYKDFEKDTNIGTIDIETYFNEMEEAVPYSIGYKTSDKLETFYIRDGIGSDDMILECINKIFTNKNHNIKLYAHNMGEFDGIMILKSLMSTANKHEYNIKIFTNGDGKIMSIDIKKRIKNKKIIKISILDSYLLLPINLNNLSGIFNTEIKKGIFPYKFVNSTTLNYIGEVPDYSYFYNITPAEYLEYVNQFKNQSWNVQKETLTYLEYDLISLFNIIMEFNQIIYEKFKINISRVRTISGLAFLIFTSKYYKESETPIYFSKGKLESYIRQAYVGGIVDVNVHYTDYTTYKYDVNSHYPNAMLQPMPGGLPRISSETNLENIFGFVEAIVEAPTERKLKVPILPVKRDELTVLFRGTVKGIFFSEELKYAVSVGYKIHKILSCVEFDRVEGVFNEYINDIYTCKTQSEQEGNKVSRYIFKLLLNSLYGRLGLKAKNCQLIILPDKDLDKIMKTDDSEVLFKQNNLNLVRSSGPLDSEIVRIINEEKLYADKTEKLDPSNPWGSNSSSVQYSAAITAYARIFLNQFKNLKNNPYLGGDTDSIIMTKPIDEKYIGTELGKFKLEHVIEEGFYPSKKFYLIKTNKNEIIIKSKGINNNKNLLNYENFKSLLLGNDLNIPQSQFKKEFKNLTITREIINKKITGVIESKLHK
uniref:Probable DNA polymerase n=1 Tax=Termitomyces bulborhizus TaxID=858892 RepID=A0A8H2S9W2_9AGAR|nr:DNA polymerase [Termitomyces bulborhizus]